MTSQNVNTVRLDEPFWSGLAKGELRIQACAACAVWTWPPQWRCGRCGSWDMVWRGTPMEGRVHVFTHTHHPFSAATVDEVPYPILLVELPAAGGARLLGRLNGSEGDLAIGARVVGEIEPAGADSLHALRWRVAPETAA